MPPLPMIPRLLLRLFLNRDEASNYSATLQELYAHRRSTVGKLKANLWLWRQVLHSIPRHHGARLLWNLMLVKNYARNALRLLSKQKLYAVINIGGLSVGLALTLFIWLYLQYETHFDTHHQDGDRIFRVIVTIQSPSFTDTQAGISPAYADPIKQIPSLEKVAFTWSHNMDSQVQAGDNIFKEESDNGLYVDQDFLGLFSVTFLQGDAATALSSPNSALITPSIAQKYFGTQQALNRILTIDSLDFRVTGIVAPPPGNSIFQQHIFKSWDVLNDPGEPSKRTAQFGGFYQTFAKVRKGIDKKQAEAEIQAAIIDRYRHYLDQSGAQMQIGLQPLRDIHFQPDIQYNLPAQGKTLYLWLFAAIALLTLGLSTINFVNLSTARAANRASEVGVRKTLGARQGQLMVQFMGESFFSVASALGIALILVQLLMPYFNTLAQAQIRFVTLLCPQGLLMILGLWLVESLAAGTYPAMVLSSFKPATVLKGKAQTGVKSGRLRSLLVTSQFAVSTLLVILALVFNGQVTYMKNRPLGFKKARTVVIDFQRHVYQYDPVIVKHEFLKTPSILGATFSSSVPGRWLYPWEMWPSGQRETNTRSIQVMGVDEDFFKLYGLDLIAGEGYGTHPQRRAFILNEQAVRAFGWDTSEEALTQTIVDQWSIAGIMKDFHFTGLQAPIGPAAFFYSPKGIYLSLKIGDGHTGEILDQIRKTYERLFPNRYFEAFLLEDDFNRLYQKEEQTGRLFNVFTGLALLIACMGLAGLSAFIAQQKTKEIGIRKILGASTHSIAGLLVGRFLKWVLLSNIIAWPLAWMGAQKMLREFAYHIDVSWGLFALAGLATLFIALFTVGFQTLKAALANPVKNLRYE